MTGTIKALLDTDAMMSMVRSGALNKIECDDAKKTFPRIKVNKTHIRGAFNQKGVITDKLVQLTFELKDSKSPDKILRRIL